MFFGIIIKIRKEKNKTLNKLLFNFISYAPDFEDLGKIYDQIETIKRDGTKQFILIFKVDKKLDKNRFVLFYQEYNGNNHYLRKKVFYENK